MAKKAAAPSPLHPNADVESGSVGPESPDDGASNGNDGAKSAGDGGSGPHAGTSSGNAGVESGSRGTLLPAPRSKGDEGNQPGNPLESTPSVPSSRKAATTAPGELN